MGGNRCCFRQCRVSNAKFPRIRFFRFPLKDNERYRKWRQYSKMEHMLQFSEVRCGNCRVCARHFRTECFMNYKMDRLIPSAVPTITRFSNNQALDFELDIENGVLVTLEKTKFKHLIPPVGFECPLSLMNDGMFLETPNELESQQYCKNMQLADALHNTDSGMNIQYEEVTMNKPGKTLVNSVEILETIQVTAPNSKRLAEKDEMERPVVIASVSKRKCRILNTTNCVGDSDIKIGTSVVLAPETTVNNNDVNNDEIDFPEADQIENRNEILHNEEPLFLTSKALIEGDCDDTNDTQFPEIHKDENTLHYELPSSDSDRDKHVDSSISPEVLKMQSQLFEFKNRSQDFDVLQIKFSVLESENKELKKTCKENKDINKKLLSLKMENNYIKNALKDYETLKDKLRKYCEENKKLKEDTASIEILRAELLSRREETKNLKNLLEILNNSQSKEQNLKEQDNLEIANERSIAMAKETIANEEIVALKRISDLQLKQLKDAESELKEVKVSLNEMKNENDRLTQQQNELQQSLKNMQNNVSIKETEYMTLKSDYDNLHQLHSILEQKYCKLQVLRNQEATVSTSLENTISTTNFTANTAFANSLTKAQLFNGIKRYLSASMVSLLRMEMFGSSEREWKTDERQVAVDILRLGEMVYKYFTDEWRFRLPALRDVRNWLTQSQQMIEDEEDL